MLVSELLSGGQCSRAPGHSGCPARWHGGRVARLAESLWELHRPPAAVEADGSPPTAGLTSRLRLPESLTLFLPPQPVLS